MTRKRRWRDRLSSLLGVALFVGALWVIQHEIRHIGVRTIIEHVERTPESTLLVAMILSAAGYLLLSSYDILAVRYIGRRLSLPKIVFTSFIGYSFSNSLSMTPSVAVRYRIYTGWGFSGLDVARIVAFHILSTWLGFFAVAGTVFLVEPEPLFSSSILTLGLRRAIGGVMLVMIGLYVTLAAHQKGRCVVVFGHEFPLPSHRLMAMQVALGSLDWALIGVVLFSLLPPTAGLNYLYFLTIFVISQMVQTVSHVPGGIGVFEGTILLFLKPFLPVPDILSALLLYRVVFNLLPLTTGSSLLLGYEIRRRLRERKRPPS